MPRWADAAGRRCTDTLLGFGSSPFAMPTPCAQTQLHKTEQGWPQIAGTVRAFRWLGCSGRAQADHRAKSRALVQPGATHLILHGGEVTAGVPAAVAWRRSFPQSQNSSKHANRMALEWRRLWNKVTRDGWNGKGAHLACSARRSPQGVNPPLQAARVVSGRRGHSALSLSPVQDGRARLQTAWCVERE